MSDDKDIAIVGAGLVGSLLGLYLRKHGHSVSIFESRADPRLNPESGRSINLIITSRGVAALTGVSDALAKRVMAITVPVFGRTLHAIDGTQTYQPYGPDPSYCNFSVSRWELNTLLIAAAEEAGCKIFFSHPLAHVDVASSTLYFYLQNPATTQLYQKRVQARHVFGTDGGGSRVRQALKGFLGDAVSDVSQPLGYGYKELTMPATPRMDPLSLHIWPRGSHFLMALPNKDHSFTITLYMHERGRDSFAELSSPAKVAAYFKQYYADTVPLMPALLDEYARNPVGFLGTVFLSHWVHADKVALMGDAAHAITPFFGQGCNSGFEDVMEFDRLLQSRATGASMGEVFAAFQRARKPNGDAIANMALDNFTEMMAKTADKRFLLEKGIEIELARRFPTQYVSRYALVTHSLVPYEDCRQIGMLQEKILHELSGASISSPEQADYALAHRLIEQHLTPYMRARGITPASFVYQSSYYPKEMPKAKL